MATNMVAAWSADVLAVTIIICNPRQYHFFIMMIILFLYIKEKSFCAYIKKAFCAYIK